MVDRFFYKKSGLGAIVTSKEGAGVNEELAQELKNSANEKSMLGVKIIFGQQI